MPGCCATGEKELYSYASVIGGRGRVVGIATRYRLYGPGNESRWKRDFPYPSRPALGPTKRLAQRIPFIFPRGGVAWAWR
jgi:hypothetical protein